MKKFIALLFLTIGAYATSMTIVNDSPYVLTARVMSANGEEVGRLTLNPQHQAKWQSYNLKGSRFSETPYTVAFTCPNGDEYGIVTYAQPGAYITARSSNGDQICKPPRKEQQQPQQQQQYQQQQQRQFDEEFKQSVTPEPVSP